MYVVMPVNKCRLKTKFFSLPKEFQGSLIFSIHFHRKRA